VKWQQLEQEHTNEPNETPLKNKNPASPDQEVRINKNATTMAA
jgi:hypothetical protein